MIMIILKGDLGERCPGDERWIIRLNLLFSD